MLAGEWMPLIFLKNEKGFFKNIKSEITNLKTAGWWNSLTAGDFDNDGDIDYVAGNVGLNSFYKASATFPSKIYGFDFNGDGGYDAIPTLYLPDINNEMKEFPAFGRDDMIKQMIGFKARFTNYKNYALAPISKILTAEEIKKALQLQATNFSSSFIKNNGNGNFEIAALPVAVQLSSVFGMMADDIDGDGNLDIIINGNDYSTEIAAGRYDGFSGLILKGDGKGNFVAMQPGQTGYYVPGDGKCLVYLKSASGKPILLAAQNQGALLAFENNASRKMINLNPTDVWLNYFFTDGTQRKDELYYGNSFYSQSGRYITATSKLKSVTITDAAGNKRTVNF
jgi:hypothetical protein